MSDPLNILFIADAYFDDLPGGSRTVASEIATRLVQLGHGVTFLVAHQNTDAPDDTRLENGIRIVRYHGASTGPKYIAAGKEACGKLIEVESFDLAHVHFAYSAVGPFLALPKSMPRVRTFHGPWDEEGWIADTYNPPEPLGMAKAMLKRLFRRRIEVADLRRSDQIIVLSDAFASDVIKRLGLPATKVTKIVGGIDTQRFRPTEGRSAARERLGLPLDRPILLSIRRLTPRMGLDRLIGAMPVVLDKHPDALLVIGGKGPALPQLSQQVSALNLDRSVTFAGFIPDHDLASYYEAADLFVLPTIALEGFGMVTCEALSSGTPVIGTAVGATPEILGQLDLRLIAPEATPQALAGSILDFLGNEYAQALTPQKLHQFVEDRYTWERNVAATLNIYRRVIAGRSA